MGAGEAAALSKADKVSSPVQEQTSIYARPDWAALQAYYGPGISILPSYFTAIASGHAPPHPYMWGPQPMMSPYAMPYAAIYHGVLPHPSVPLTVSPSSMATPEKLTSNRGKGLLKRFKRHDGNAVPAGGGTAEDATGNIMLVSLQSGEGGVEGSSSVSEGNSESEENNNNQRSSSSEDTPLISGKGEKSVTLDNATHGGVANSANTPRELVGTISSSIPTPRTEGTIPANGQVQVRAAPVAPAPSAMVQGHGGVSMELWTQDESEVKRERRKQSNRESARRSRLRKQAEGEELSFKAETLNDENRTLKCEIYRVKDNIEKLRRENSALKEKLKEARSRQPEEISSVEIDPEESPPVCTENLLSKLNNSSTCNSIGPRENDAYDNSKGRLRQLLDSSTRTDAVAAG